MENNEIKQNTQDPPASPTPPPVPPTPVEPPTPSKEEVVEPAQEETISPTPTENIDETTEPLTTPTLPIEPEKKIKTETLPKKEAEVIATPPSAPSPSSSSPATKPASAIQATDTFPARFKEKIKKLLGMANKKRREQADEHVKKIMDYTLKHNRIDNKTARKITGLKDERVRQYLNQLEKEKKLVQMGSNGPKVFYMPIKKQ